MAVAARGNIILNKDPPFLLVINFFLKPTLFDLFESDFISFLNGFSFSISDLLRGIFPHNPFKTTSDKALIMGLGRFFTISFILDLSFDFKNNIKSQYFADNVIFKLFFYFEVVDCLACDPQIKQLIISFPRNKIVFFVVYCFTFNNFIY